MPSLTLIKSSRNLKKNGEATKCVHKAYFTYTCVLQTQNLVEFGGSTG